MSMGGELVLVRKEQAVPATGVEETLPALVERAGGAARFAWDEFFYAEHHNKHTQRAYQAAVRRFLAWVEGEGVELASISPGMVGQYLVALGGSPSKRNQHLAALRGFFDRLVQRHVVMLNPAASVSGVKEQVIEGKTPEITLDQAVPPGEEQAGGGGRGGGAGGGAARPGNPVHDAVYRLPGRGGRQAAAGRFPA
jgi:Phage integrase, N-terminal SAM-like domain